MEIVTFAPYDQNKKALCAVLHGEIDHHTARPMRDAIDRHVLYEKPAVLEISFEDVPLMDSSGIGLILGRTETMRLLGGGVDLSHLSGELSRVIRLSGIEKIKNITLLP